MNKENIYVKGLGNIEICPKNTTLINSTHVDKPIRVYEIWEECTIGDKTIDLFVIRKHTPWVDNDIINDKSLIKKILDYTQTPKNNIVKTFKINSEIAITEYHKDWYPLIIKSANNFYSKEYGDSLKTKFYNYFSDKTRADVFYKKVIDKHKKISDDLGVSFEDVAPNNIIVNNNFSNFKIIDISSLRKEKFNNKYSLTQIIYGDGANDLGFINSNILKKEWDSQLLKENPITFCISTFNNLPYLKIAIDSVRKNSYFKEAPFIIHAENCSDGTDEWLKENSKKYNLEYYIDKNDIPLGIGGGMNFCADRVKTEFIMFLHSDFYVTKNWDKSLLDLFDQFPDKKMWVNSHRIEPNMFGNSVNRPGTVIVEKDIFGAYYNDFQIDEFEEWAQEFIQMNDFQIPKGEGVSGLIRKKDWDEIGGNDPIFAPASWDDMDLFLRMLQKDFKFILTSKSLVWHFGARGSHRLEENNNQSSQRQKQAEQRNVKKWLDKWKSLPIFDEYGMIKGLQ